MKQIAILKVIFIGILGFAAVNVNAFQYTTPDSYYNQGGGVPNPKCIIIIDVMGIGSNANPSYAEVCPGNSGANVTSGQTITLTKVTPDTENFTATKLGFRSLTSLYNFVEFHSWIDCSDHIVLADVRLYGNVKQTIIKNANNEITEVRFFIQGSPFQVRIFSSPGGAGINVVTMGAKGVNCSDVYQNPCYMQVGQRTTDPSDTETVHPVSSLQVSPNPFTSVFESYLNLPVDGEVKVLLLDITGREVRSMNFAGTAGDNQFSIEGEDLTAGLYFLTVLTDSGQVVERVMKK